MKAPSLSNFEICTQVVASLTPAQKSGALKFISAFEVTESKATRLFTCIVKRNGELSFEEAFRGISRGSLHAKYQICSRLKDLLLEYISSAKNLERKDGHSEYFKATAKTLRRFIQANALYHVEPVALALMEEARTLSKRFDLHWIHAEVVQWLATELSIRQKSSLKAYQEEVDHAKLRRDAIDDIRWRYFEYYSEANIKANLDEKYALFMLAIGDAQNTLTQTSSIPLEYYLISMQTEFYNVQGDKEMTFKKSEEAIDLIKNNEAIYFKNRLSNAYINLMDNALRFHFFEKGYHLFEHAIALLTPGTQHYHVAKEYRFRFAYHLGHTEEAQILLDELLNEPKLSEWPSYHSKCLYYKAWLAYEEESEASIHEALNILAQRSDITNDKEGWNIGIRLLSICCLMKRGDDYGVAQKLLALKEFIRPLKKEGSVRERDLLLLQVFQCLDRHGYQMTEACEASLTQLLDELTNEHPWTAYSFELAPLPLLIPLSFFQTKAVPRLKKTEKKST